MNISSSIFYQFIKKEKGITAKYVIVVMVLTIIHSYIFLSFLSVIILLCYACTTKGIIIKILLWSFATIISIVTSFMAYLQAKRKLNDEKVGKQEPLHVDALSFNAIISPIGFFVLIIFPKIITFGWTWVEHIMNKLI
jgi:hypothetical protein